MRNAIQRWAPFIGQLGADPVAVIDQAVNYLHALNSGSNEQRIATLHEISRRFGIRFGDDPQQIRPEDDPLGIQQQIQASQQPLLARIDALTRAGNATNHQNATRHDQQIRQTVDSFADAKADDGKPLHPHFEEVAQKMAGMVQAELASGQPVDLAKLYDEACWSVPSVREKLLASQSGNGTSGSFAPGQGPNNAAARAAGSLTGRGRSSETEQPDDLETALRQNMRSVLST